MKRTATEKALISKRKKMAAGDTLRKAANYRKRHPLDCGKSQCRVCHPNKYPKRQSTRQEKLADSKES